LLNTTHKQQTKAAQALREIMQEIALAGLSRAGFFEKAAFYGGTALRIFNGLDRFSEDLDFSLLQVNPVFTLDPYLPVIEAEFAALGIKVSVRDKKKTLTNNIEPAFLKSDTIWKELVLESTIPQNELGQKPSVKIKLELDREPPLGFETVDNLLIRPVSFYVKCFTLPPLFAEKMHELLFRKWKTNVKGRDWYGLEWYIKKGVPLSLDHFVLRAQNSGDWTKPNITEKEFRSLLTQRIQDVNMTRMKADIQRFIPDPERIKLWSPKYFNDLAKHLTIKT